MSVSDIRWVAYQPLIGGAAIGAERAFGTAPTCILSYNGVINDDLYDNYMNNVRGMNVPHYFLNDFLYSMTEDGPWDKNELKNIDVVIGVPICAGLSSANTQNGANSKMGRGSDAFQNNNMLGMLINTLKHIKPKVYIFENAYKLATSLGDGIREKMQQIANDYGYSTTIVKVDTFNHGLPQKRTRTFFYAWKDDSAYDLVYKESPHKLIMDVIGDLKNQKAAAEIPNMKNWLAYLKDKFGDNYRAEWEKRAHGADEILSSFDDFDYAMKFFNEKDQKRLQYWKEKKAKGLGWMAESPLWFGPDKISSLYIRSMTRLMHPTEERTYSVREIMRLMGLPDDLPDDNIKSVQLIGQNVPVCTAEYYCRQVVSFLNGDLKKSSQKNLMLDFCSVKQKSSEVKSAFQLFLKS